MENNMYYVIHEGELASHYGYATLKEAQAKMRTLSVDTGEEYLIVSKVDNEES